MNKMKKIAIFGASLLAVTALTACQSPHATQESAQHHMHAMQQPMDMMSDDQHRHMMAHMQEGQMGAGRELTPEQRAAWEKHRAEHRTHFEQVRKACEGKTAGQSVQVKLGDTTIQGTCELRFQPSAPAMMQQPKH
ncbi:hypothetical protein [Acinetobacter sp. GSS19]|uniref:hypothetical protein n=1 Tax=Acinetobacter sp. GSS19 TaxID=3020716 RepID=UPI00235EE77A|nr:hypothetical protein [Acinetobacter sp. GSS19]